MFKNTCTEKIYVTLKDPGLVKSYDTQTKNLHQIVLNSSLYCPNLNNIIIFMGGSTLRQGQLPLNLGFAPNVT